MLELTAASWRQHRRRYVATFLAVFLGVGFCAATLSLTAAARQGAADTVALQYSRADVVAYPSSAAAEGVASRVSRLSEVSAVAQVDTAYVDVTWPAGHAAGSESVSEIPAAPTLRWQGLTAGVFPRGPHQVVVDSGLAAAEDVVVGTRLVLGGGSGSDHAVTVVGLVEPSHGAAGVSPLFTASGVLRGWHAPDRWSAVVARGAEGVSQSTLADRVQELAPGDTVSTAAALREQAVRSLTGNVDAIGRFLTGFAVVSLFVAGLVIANTFRIVMTQRIKDLALLRCVGAERWQIFAMSIGEAGVLGVCAAAAGTAAGIGLSALLVAAARHTSVDVPLASGAPGWSALAWPFAGGLVMVVAAALSPAWWASRVTPLAALRGPAPAPVRSRAGAGQAGVGVLLALVGSMLIGLAVVSGQLLPGLAGGMLSFSGVLALTVIVVPASIRLFGSARCLLPRRWRGGVPAELSVLDATRNPRRTAATAAALLVGVTLISMMSVGAASVSASEADALDRVAPVDLTVSGRAVPPGLLAATREVEGIRRVATVDGLTVRTAEGEVAVGALRPQDLVVVRDGELRRQLGSVGVVVVPVSAQSQVPGGGVRPFVLRSGEAEVRLRPVLSSLSTGPLLVAPEVLRRLGGQPAPVALYAELAAGVDPLAVVSGIRDTIAGTAPDTALVVAGGFAERSTYDRTISVLLLISTALLGVAVLIALVGVGNTLSLSVLERTREHGLLRALGLTSGQLRLLLANEAVLISGSAALLGTALGVAYGWAGTLTLLHGTTHSAPSLALPFARLTLIVVVAVVAGLLASVLPARRAVRLSPVAALAAD